MSSVRRRAVRPLLVIVLVAVGALTFTFAKGYAPILGLDLQGGVSVVLQPEGEASDSALDQAVAIIRQRVDALGVAEPEITRQGNTILVQIPGVADRDRAIELVGQTAELRFRPVLAAIPADAELGAPPGDGPPADQAPPDGQPQPSDRPDEPTTDDAPGQDEGAWGPVGVGEVALGAQPGETVPDSTPADDPTGEPADAPADDPADVPPADGDAPVSPAPTTAAGLLPPDVCVVGVPTDQDVPDQPVILPQCDGDQLVAVYQLGPTLLTGESLEGADPVLNQQGQWTVNPIFREGDDGIGAFNRAASQCASASQACPTGQLAIVLDGRVVSAPSIQQASFTRDQITISGSFDEGSARDLATVLRYGALPVVLEQQQVQLVSATLGRDALTAGLWAGLVGFILVCLYMVLTYRILGVLAICKLAIEAALLWSVISYLGATSGLALTLAGVTGLIVAIGLSVDSNVVYYEHLKEEVHKGRSLRTSVDRAFNTSFRTIFAADFASLLGAFLLWWLTVGAVRGFALNLGIATILDLVVAWAFMRPAVALAVRSDLAARRPRWFGLPTGPTVVAEQPAPRARVEVGS